ncbi:hypothetical protein AMTRI_Chr01g129170 [Amborella trichopoda]|uniref:C2 domain-containing protein n=1 Tax=Amborella trichopoda TaxID=13333 RepID=U5D7D3_AMBTC|nr:uncharacterized protein LOC18444578 [Amborella trichopoda]ERN16273.1 hypothetical protein AMTR_s00063p00175250 [Amborella trichopoda]|eukprot:XP_006854806.1 uncharacterized protein LOC18444578 [Amborella trichopoda]
MDSFNQSSGYCYSHGSEAMGDAEFSAMLELYVHHARNIHNICIYDNQDVYAKFSLTSSPDETLSTRIINGGGRNPQFNENLQMKITQPDAVLKCEIWMLSRARNYLEDQLLGFALVSLSTVLGKGKMTEDFTLSSTDLIHSPAGTVRLSLFLDPNSSQQKHIQDTMNSQTHSPSSISSEVVLLDRKGGDVVDPVEYSSIEFPDINAVREDQQMVSEYFATRPSPGSPFLHLGSSSQGVADYDMTVNAFEENSTSPDDSPKKLGSGSYQSPMENPDSYGNSGILSSTTTSLSNNSGDSSEKKTNLGTGSHVGSASAQSPENSPETPTSKRANGMSEKEEAEKDGRNMGSVELGSVFTSPLVNINLEPEQSVVQQQIVDMYMKSMQQFTESLANMKLPMDLDKQGAGDGGDAKLSQNKMETNKKKEGPRVFYGSRAFF